MQSKDFFDVIIMCDDVLMKEDGSNDPVVSKLPSGCVGSKHGLVVSLYNPKGNRRDLNRNETWVTLLLVTIVTSPEDMFDV